MSQLFKFGANKPREASPATSAAARSASIKAVLSDELFDDMRNLIYDKCGIYYTDSKKYLLESRLSKRLAVNKMDNFEDYYKLLATRASKEELESLFEVITINETYFFRAPFQFDAFEKILVPEILKKRITQPNPVFRIWSAASSSGEEAYTLAILVLERLRHRFPRVQFQILGSDISNQVLESARQGLYKQYAIRNIPENLLEKYFTKEGSNFRVKNEVKSLVKFVNLNLYDHVAMSKVKNCDVIFCANVLIYFDIPSKQKVVSNLYNSLNKGGYLFIGYSESLHGISKAFKLVHLPKAMAYKKE